MLALLPVVAALGALGFVAAVVAAHLLRDDLPALDATLSAYFSGSTRVLMFTGYIALASALLATTTILANAPLNLAQVFAALLCLLAAVCLIPIALTARRDLSVSDARNLLTIWFHRWAALLAHGVLQKTLVAAIVLWIWLVSFTEGMASP